jgi:hypothetical protein
MMCGSIPTRLSGDLSALGTIFWTSRPQLICRLQEFIEQVMMLTAECSHKASGSRNVEEIWMFPPTFHVVVVHTARTRFRTCTTVWDED